MNNKKVITSFREFVISFLVVLLIFIILVPVYLFPECLRGTCSPNDFMLCIATIIFSGSLSFSVVFILFILFATGEPIIPKIINYFIEKQNNQKVGFYEEKRNKKEQ